MVVPIVFSLVEATLAKPSMNIFSFAPTMKNGTVILKPSDVLHVPGLGFDDLVGYSPIAMAKNAIGLAIATEEYGAKFFANEARPGDIFEYPGTVKNPEAIKESRTKCFSGNTCTLDNIYPSATTYDI